MERKARGMVLVIWEGIVLFDQFGDLSANVHIVTPRCKELERHEWKENEEGGGRGGGKGRREWIPHRESS